MNLTPSPLSMNSLFAMFLEVSQCFHDNISIKTMKAFAFCIVVVGDFVYGAYRIPLSGCSDPFLYVRSQTTSYAPLYNRTLMWSIRMVKP